MLRSASRLVVLRDSWAPRLRVQPWARGRHSPQMLRVTQAGYDHHAIRVLRCLSARKNSSSCEVRRGDDQDRGHGRGKGNDRKESGIREGQAFAVTKTTRGDMLGHRELKIKARQWVAPRYAPALYGLT